MPGEPRWVVPFLVSTFPVPCKKIVSTMRGIQINAMNQICSYLKNISCKTSTSHTLLHESNGYTAYEGCT